jgi:hypothetical protein
MEVKMEKISRIVRGNSRVASTDLKSAAAVRPGAPSFGRPMGQSTSAGPSAQTTAEKAVALHNDMLAKKKTGGDQIVQSMADSFFMNRISRSTENEPGSNPGEVQAGPVEMPEDGIAVPIPTDQLVKASASDDDVIDQPPGYKPRGSFVDVRA